MATEKQKKQPRKRQYFEGVGRRKTAVARVRISKSSKANQLVVNEKSPQDYFDTEEMVEIVNSPFLAVGKEKGFEVSVKVKGGGKKAQAEAIRLGISRALVKFDGEYQTILRDLDYLKRDPRKKERKKAGLKKARRAPQWSKR